MSPTHLLFILASVPVILTQDSNCYKEFTEPAGTIESPLYPENYPNGAQCKYDVAGEKGLDLHLVVHHLDLGDGDKLEIFKAGAAVGGIEEESELLATDEGFEIKFSSNGKESGGGFSLEYELLCETQSFTGPSGTFSSKNYPQPYPNRASCAYEIRVEEGYNVEITFTSFQLDQGDNVRIYEGSPEDFDQIEVLTNVQNGHKVQSTGSFVTVVLESDESVAGKGFEASYVQSCGGVFEFENRPIMSPNFPNSFISGLECSYLVFVEEGQVPIVHFDEFDLGADSSLKIFNGQSDASPLIVELKGTDGELESYMGTGQYLLLKLTSGGTGPGFSASHISYIPEAHY